MIERREVFREKCWTVSDVAHGRVHVGHIDCSQSNMRTPGSTELTNATTYTWADDDMCWFCDEEFPDFIRNMLIFMKWCGGR